ncbi:uncharacterized protein N7459_006439 [Penicillium hispanicum]|uniref:uncharacterized protein n=1 Tax=Penicillium hispanicum TaxID=1080232 RepID=UPI002541FD94|nr:uncharacterized protein N7459_006439 [Penicillium hispanicum]KAJ5577475.1 hypothetical protein N7459_006439 [Penicillium hispanicum]
MRLFAWPRKHLQAQFCLVVPSFPPGATLFGISGGRRPSPTVRASDGDETGANHGPRWQHRMVDKVELSSNAFPNHEVPWPCDEPVECPPSGSASTRTGSPGSESAGMR